MTKDVIQPLLSWFTGTWCPVSFFPHFFLQYLSLLSTLSRKLTENFVFSDAQQPLISATAPVISEPGPSDFSAPKNVPRESEYKKNKKSRMSAATVICLVGRPFTGHHADPAYQRAVILSPISAQVSPPSKVTSKNPIYCLPSCNLHSLGQSGIVF